LVHRRMVRWIKVYGNMDCTEETRTHLSLCAGYGGIDLGLHRIVRGMRTVAYAEIDAFAVEVLLARMEDGSLDAAPIWTDVRDFPWHLFRGCVDILSSGYPCQPFSGAGLRKGENDERHLWPSIRRGIEAVRPCVVFLENVEGHISMGLSSVISDLEELGYQAAWGIFSAAECGAPHQRKRVFIAAISSDAMRERGQLPLEWVEPAIQDAGGDGTARRTEDGWICRKCGEDVFCGCRCEHGESQCPRCEEWTYPFVYEPRDGCSQCGSMFPEWSDITTWPIEPCIRGGDDGSANRVDRLRLLGNGVVPATAERAFRVLIEELDTREILP
jgi:DNA (cytosine-5)-methyltransferase 1